MIAGFRRQDCETETLELTPVLAAGEYKLTNLTTGATFNLVSDGSTAVKIHFKDKPESCVLMYERQ